MSNAAPPPDSTIQPDARLIKPGELAATRKAIEAAQQEWETSLDVLDILIFTHDTQFRILRCNEAYQQAAGIPFRKIIGQPYYQVFPKVLQPPQSSLRATTNAETEEEKESEVHVGQATYRSRSFPVRDAQGVHLYSVHTLEDITERKRAEKELKHTVTALQTLTAVNRSLVYASEENSLLQNICDAIAGHHGYLLAWVGYVQHDENKSVKVMAHAGHDEGYLDAMRLTWAETGRGMGLVGRTIRSGTTQLCQDIATDASFLPWRAAAMQRGYAASISLPLLDESHAVFGVLIVYAGDTDAFTPMEVTLLEQMAGDLAFGIHAMQVSQQRDQATAQSQLYLERLGSSLEGTIQAMAGLVEMRDPYTAGHQERVADLAEAIARQMGLPDEQMRAIHLGAMVHDLGKIKIPSEILSKPGKISDLEYAMVKTHAQAGFDILKDIEFPWPIAQMVLQHHERMDGSGYPQGLKGEAISLEARILAVADVVEAIASHRPYRPGLGIKAALAEITKHSGVHYDQTVVEACLALFREHQYHLKPTSFN